MGSNIPECKGNMRRQSCCATKGPGLDPLPSKIGDPFGSVVVANEWVLSHVFLHVFALFRLIEDAATCVWGLLATRIVAQVTPFSPHPLHPPLAPKGTMVSANKSHSYWHRPINQLRTPPIHLVSLRGC